MTKECTLEDINNQLTANRVNSFGFYESCVLNNTLNYYFLAKYLETDDLKDVDPAEFIAPPFNMLGLCTTIACSRASLSSLYDTIFDQIPPLKGRKLGPVNITQMPEFLENNQKLDYTVVIFWSVMAILAWFAILSTLVNYRLRRRYFRLYKEKFGQIASQKNIMIKVNSKLKTLPWRHFDLKENFKKLVSPPRFKDGVSQTFTVARAFAMLLVILGHEALIRLQLSDRYTSDFKAMTKFFQASVGVGFAQMGFYSVSMFFFIGGFVSIMSSDNFYEKAKKAKRGCCSCYLYMVLRRYVRMAPILFVIELYAGRALRDIGSSPSTLIFFRRSKEECTTWKLLAELTLLIPTQGCGGWVWYIQCDFHMFIILMLVVLLTKTAKAKTIFMSILIALSFISSGTAMYLAYASFEVLTEGIVYNFAFYRLRIYLTGALIGYFLNRKVSLKKKEREDEERREARMTHQEKWTKIREWLASSDGPDEEEAAPGSSEPKYTTDGDDNSLKRKKTTNLFVAKTHMLTDQATERNLDALSKPFTTDQISTSKKNRRRTSKRRSSLIIPNSNISKRRERNIDLIVLSVCFFVLILMFVWYNSGFQAPHFTPRSPVAVEIGFYLFGSFLIVLSFLGVLYKVITWSEAIKRSLRRSPVVNLLSNLSFCIYMSHFCVILTSSNLLKNQYSLYFYDILGFFFTDTFYTIIASLFLALFVELPFGSLWRTYVDGWFLRVGKPKIEEKEEGRRRVKSVLN